MMVREFMQTPWTRLANVQRYSTFPMIHRESVAEHSYFVCLLSYNMAEDINSQGGDVNLERVMRLAIVHDLDEALTGDFPRPFKHSSVPLLAAIQKQTKVAMENELPPTWIMADWNESQKYGTAENSIVKFCDLWSVVIYAVREAKLGNQHATEILERAPTWFKERDWGTYVAPYVKELLMLLEGGHLVDV